MGESRILTTHVGSLVRPPDFTALLREKASGREYPASTPRCARCETSCSGRSRLGSTSSATASSVRVSAGNSTSIERLSGFSEPAATPRAPAAGGRAWGDFARFADFYAEMFPKEQYQERPFPCTGPISYTGHAALQRDIDNLKPQWRRPGARRVSAGCRPGECHGIVAERLLQDRRGIHVRDRRSTASRIQDHPRRRPLCRSTMRTCRSCTTGWCRRRATKTTFAGPDRESTH